MTDEERRTNATERIARRKETRARRIEAERAKARRNWTPLIAAVIFVALLAGGFFAFTQGMLPIPAVPAGTLLPSPEPVEYGGISSVLWQPDPLVWVMTGWHTEQSIWLSGEVLWQPYWL